MPEISLEIGGRSFKIACDPGEEASLKSAAEMLAVEARRLEDAIGRVPESRMLLMAGLMLADRTKALEITSQTSESRLQTLEARLMESEAKLAALTIEINAQPAPEENDLFENKAAPEALEKSILKLEALLQT